MATDNRNLVGSVLGECRLERVIGRGGMSSVYLGRQVRPARYVAVKVLGPQMSPNETVEDYQTFLTRFRREADIVAKLEHVNIIPLYAYGEENQLAYIIMPYISGGSLSDVIRERGKLSLQQTLIYLQQAAAALDYAHARNVVHRDLKPSNFLLYPEDNRLVLADFGIARIAAESPYSANETTLTQAGTAPGTLAYMAPEMLRDGKSIDYRVDIYALGIVLYQMLSGELPFQGDLYTLISKQLSEPLPLLHPRDPSIPSGIDDVLRKATAKAREDRYASAGELASDFRIAASKTYGGMDAEMEGLTTPSARPFTDFPRAPQSPSTPANSRLQTGSNGSASALRGRPVEVPYPAPAQDGSRVVRGGTSSNPYNDTTIDTARGNRAGRAEGAWYSQQQISRGSPSGDPAAMRDYRGAQEYAPAAQVPATPAVPVSARVAATPPYTRPPRRRSPWRGIVVLFLIIAIIAGGLIGLRALRQRAVTPPPPPASPTAQAKQVIQDYYTDVNNRDYRAAYDLLTPGFQKYLGSYDHFVSGYANTKHDDISFGTSRQVSPDDVDVVTTIRALEARPQGDVTSTYRLRYTVVRLNGSWKIQSGVVV